MQKTKGGEVSMGSVYSLYDMFLCVGFATGPVVGSSIQTYSNYIFINRSCLSFYTGDFRTTCLTIGSFSLVILIIVLVSGFSGNLEKKRDINRDSEDSQQPLLV